MNNKFNPGNFFILGFDGITPAGDFLRLIESYPPSGFLLMDRNYDDPAQIKSLVSRLRSVAGDDILLAIDQEPGRVQRFRKGFPESKLPSEYLKDNSMDEFKLWCSDTASILAEVGIDINLAPVTDLMPTDRDFPVLDGRSFGDGSAKVAEFARILVEEHKKKNVLTCAKHFPGLGAASFDPHESMSISDESLARFEDYHWHPFRTAINFGVDMIMTTHLLAPSLDSENCATYSRRIIDYLRHMRHTGLIISDDLCMKGAGRPHLIDKSSIKSIYAGHNLIIISGDVEMQLKAIKGVSLLFENDESFHRVAMENEKIIEEHKSKIRS
jgi:beta-N-acetylhexosaminidase